MWLGGGRDRVTPVSPPPRVRRLPSLRCDGVYLGTTPSLGHPSECRWTLRKTGTSVVFSSVNSWESTHIPPPTTRFIASVRKSRFWSLESRRLLVSVGRPGCTECKRRNRRTEVHTEIVVQTAPTRWGSGTWSFVYSGGFRGVRTTEVREVRSSSSLFPDEGRRRRGRE